MELLSGSAVVIGLVIVALFVYQAFKGSKAGTDPAAAATAKLSATGDVIKAKFESVLLDVTGGVDDIESTALDFGTLALYRLYMKHVAAADQSAVTDAFQSLRTINAKLPPVKTS